MARIVVVGGHGRTGKLIVEQLVKNGDTVVATIRNPKHMADLVKLGAETVILDLKDSSGPEFAFVFKAADAVVFAAGSGENESSEIDRTGVLKTVRAAVKAKVPRYVAVSAMGATYPVPDRWDVPDMADYWKAKRAANKTVRESGLKWTIIEPGELTESKGTGKVTLSQNDVKVAAIPRADVAATVVAALGEPKSAGKTFQVVGGSTAVGAAMKAESAKAAIEPPPLRKPAAKKAQAKKATAKKAPAQKAGAKKAAAKKVPAKKALAKKAAKKAR